MMSNESSASASLLSSLGAMTAGISAKITDSAANKIDMDGPETMDDEQRHAVTTAAALYSDLASTISETGLEISSSSRKIDVSQPNTAATPLSIDSSEMETIPSATLASEEGVPTPPPSPTSRKNAVEPRFFFVLLFDFLLRLYYYCRLFVHFLFIMLIDTSTWWYSGLRHSCLA